MKPVETAGGIIVNDRGEVVIAKQSNKFVPWSFPKGHVEEGEDLFAAALREIEEESGLTELEFIKKLPVYDRPVVDKEGRDSSEIKRFHYYLFKTKQIELKPKDPTNPEARWVTKNEALEMLINLKDKEFFQSIVGEI